MMKKGRLMLVWLLLLSMCFNFTYAENSRPSDLEGHWAAGIIQNWVEGGYLKGYPDGSYKPDGWVTRAEFVVMVNQMFGYHTIEHDDRNFSDVSKTDWYADQARTGYQNDYLNWIQTDEFKGNTPITRAEAAAVLAIVAKKEVQTPEAILSAFSDGNAVPLWSRAYVAAMVEAGYMNGYEDHTLRVGNSITRAEAIVMIDHVAGMLYDKAITETSEAVPETIEGNVTITTGDVVLYDKTIQGDLLLAAGIGEGDVFLNRITVLGEVIVQGGGENSIHFNQCQLGEMIVDKPTGNIRVVSNESKVTDVVLQSNAILEGFFNETDLSVRTPGIRFQLDGVFHRVIVDETAEFEVSKGAKIQTVIFNKPAAVSGDGEIESAVVEADGVTVAQGVQQRTTAPGIDASGVKVNTAEKKQTTSTGHAGGNNGGTSPDTTLPTTGGSGAITVGGVTASGVTLTYAKASDDRSAQAALTYLAYYSTIDNLTDTAATKANGTPFGTAQADIASITITGLAENTTYYFNVMVTDEAGNQSAYTSTSAKTPLSPDTALPTVGGSGAITTGGVTTSGVTLTYAKASDDRSAQAALTYRAYYSTADNLTDTAATKANGTPFGTAQADITSIAITGLAENTTYYFNVMVTDEAGNQSAYTSTSAKTPLSPDTALPTVGGSGAITTGSVTASSVTLTYAKASDNRSAQDALTYRAYYSTADNLSDTAATKVNGTPFGTAQADITSIAITGLAENTTYYFNVMVTDEAGNQSAYISTNAKTTFSPGDGSPSDPFKITTIEALAKVGSGVDGWLSSSDYLLFNDLDFQDASSYSSGTVNTAFTSGTGWTPLPELTGTFNGGSHTIDNLYINNTALSRTGLISVARGPITDLHLTNVDVTGGSTTGTIAGETRNNVRNCTSSGTVTGNNSVGGLIGFAGDQAVYYCHTNGTVTGYKDVGGMVGTASRSNIYYAYSKANVYSGYDNLGGLIGAIDHANVTGCYASGNVFGNINSTGAQHVGGLCGYVYGGIYNSYATGDVNGNGANRVGGLAGHLSGTGYSTSKTYASGIVSGNSDVGGLIGRIGNSTQNSIAFNPVVTGNLYVNRYAGYLTSSWAIDEAYAYQYMNIVPKGSSTIVDNSVYEIITERGGANLIVLNNALLGPMSSWDFDTADADNDMVYWQILSGADRPILFVKEDGQYRRLGDDDGKLTDRSAPMAVVYVPSVNAVSVTTSSALEIHFNEAIQKGSGNLVIKKLGTNDVFETIDVTGVNAVINDKVLRVSPTMPLENTTIYYVNIDSGAVEDIVGNDYTGITDDTTWRFTTE